MKASTPGTALLAGALVVLVAGGAWLAPRLQQDAAAPGDCDLGERACVQALADGGKMELSITPRPIPTLAPLTVRVEISGSTLTPTAVDFQGVDMDMGSNRTPLVADATPAAGAGGQAARSFSGSLQIPVCSTGRMRWQANVRFAGEASAPAFHFWSGASRQGRPSALAPAEVAGGDFTLPGADGERVRPISLHEFRGKAVLLYFGYTYCPDICPTSLTLIREALAQLSAEERRRVQVVFVSVDPARDTPEHLRDYLGFFAPEMIGLVGDREETARVARAWGAFYQVQPADEKGRYSVDHSAFTTVIDGEGRFVGRLAHGSPSAEIVAALRPLLAHPR